MRDNQIWNTACFQKTIDSLVRKGILEKSGSGSYHSTVTCHKKKDLTAPLPVSEINSTARPFVESDDGALLMLLNSNPDNPDKDVWAELAVRGYEISVKSNGEFKISKLNGTWHMWFTWKERIILFMENLMTCSLKEIGQIIVK